VKEKYNLLVVKPKIITIFDPLVDYLNKNGGKPRLSNHENR